MKFSFLIQNWTKRGGKFEMEIEQLRIQSVVNWLTFLPLKQLFKKAFYFLYICKESREKWNRIWTDVMQLCFPLWTSTNFTQSQWSSEMQWFLWVCGNIKVKEKGKSSHTGCGRNKTFYFFSYSSLICCFPSITCQRKENLWFRIHSIRIVSSALKFN